MAAKKKRGTKSVTKASGSASEPSSKKAKKKAAKKVSKKVSKKASGTVSGGASERASGEAGGASSGGGVTLLSGGNPQIAKGDGEGPVRAYIAAMPGWKRTVGRRLDALIAETAPGVRRAVRWNSPFYGVEGRGWFLSFHCFTRYVKVTFLNGASLRPSPPEGSKVEGVRYLHIHEGEKIDEAQLVSWIRQGAEMEGEDLF